MSTDYRGKCIALDRNVDRLQSVGLDRAIASVREPQQGPARQKGLVRSAHWCLSYFEKEMGMMHRWTLALILCGAMAPVAPAAAAQTDSASSGERLICRGREKTVGSRIRRGPVCKTADQWRLDVEKTGKLLQSGTRTGTCNKELHPGSC